MDHPVHVYIMYYITVRDLIEKSYATYIRTAQVNYFITCVRR